MAAIFPPRTTSNIPPAYGSTDDTGYTVSSGFTQDTAASVTFTTSATNTKWLVEITAEVANSAGAGSARAQVKVDGSGIDTDGVCVFAASSAKDVFRGRAVVTLATAASHTLLAQFIAAGTDVTFDTVTLTAEQLTG